MASETATRSDVGTETGLEHWQAGVVGGIAGSILFGAMMAAMVPAMLAEMIPALYGLEGELAGWIIHISNGAVLGVVFAAILVAIDRPSLDVGPGVVAGVVYGIVVWAALAVVVMPIWLGMPEMVPNLDGTSLIGHVLYGAVLGVVYAILAR